MPLAFVAAALAGVAIALSLTAGRPRLAPPQSLPTGTATARLESPLSRQDNDLVWNPAAFFTAACLISAVVLIGVLIEVA